MILRDAGGTNVCCWVWEFGQFCSAHIGHWRLKKGVHMNKLDKVNGVEPTKASKWVKVI